MQGYLSALLDPALPFVRNALIAGILSAVLFGILGAVVTVRRIAGLAGAISHAVLGGIGIALYLRATGAVPGAPPVAFALAFALVAAAIIAYVSRKAKQREDTVINALWALGMSVGVLFIAKTPGYVDPMSYLFGNILLVSETELWVMLGLDILVAFLAWRFYPQIEACAFDEEFAKVRGVRADGFFVATLAVVAVSVVLLQTSVGIVMVIAMLTLPAGTAGFAAKSLAGLMAGSVALSALFSAGGLAASWELDLPAGAVVVALAGIAFIAASLARSIQSRITARGSARRATPGAEARLPEAKP